MPSGPQRQRNAVRTYALRAAICLVLQAAEGRPMSITDITAALRRQGVVIPGRPSKTISDATRTDIRMGRIVRTGRGSYAYRRLPRSTAYDMRRRVNAYIANPDARRPKRGVPTDEQDLPG